VQGLHQLAMKQYLLHLQGQHGQMVLHWIFMLLPQQLLQLLRHLRLLNQQPARRQLTAAVPQHLQLSWNCLPRCLLYCSQRLLQQTAQGGMLSLLLQEHRYKQTRLAHGHLEALLFKGQACQQQQMLQYKPQLLMWQLVCWLVHQGLLGPAL
jgi:hypothetical protein